MTFVLLHWQFCSLRACWLGEMSIVAVDLFVSEVGILHLCMKVPVCVCVCVCNLDKILHCVLLLIMLPNRTIRNQDCYTQSRPSFI